MLTNYEMFFGSPYQVSQSCIERLYNQNCDEKVAVYAVSSGYRIEKTFNSRHDLDKWLNAEYEEDNNVK